MHGISLYFNEQIVDQHHKGGFLLKLIKAPIELLSIFLQRLALEGTQQELLQSLLLPVKQATYPL